MGSARAALSKLPLRCRAGGEALAGPQAMKSLSSFTAAPPGPAAAAAAGGDSLVRRRSFLANLLQRYGFPSSTLAWFLRCNRFLLDSEQDGVKTCVKILLSFGLSQDSLVSVVSSCPRVLELGFLRRWELAFSQIGFSPVPPVMVRRILEQSWRCRIEPEDVRRSCQALLEAGFCKRTVAKVLEELPSTRMNSAGINRRVGFLKEIGCSEEEIDRIVCSFPGFLALSSEGRLQPLLEDLRELNLEDDEVRRSLLENPRALLTMEAGELPRCVELLMSLKCRLPIKDRILCEGPVLAGVRVKLRVDLLCRHGLIRRDAFKVLWKEPRTILYELDDIETKIDFLIRTLGFGIDWLVEVPEYLGVNLQKLVVPRYKVIEHLRSQKALGFQVDLRQLIKPSRNKFYNMFVKPYPDCEGIFGGPPGDARPKPRHPPGLWTLFRPPAHPQTQEDVRNMRLFMESLVNTS